MSSTVVSLLYTSGTESKTVLIIDCRLPVSLSRSASSRSLYLLKLPPRTLLHQNALRSILAGSSMYCLTRTVCAGLERKFEAGSAVIGSRVRTTRATKGQRTKERDRLSAVQQPVVVREGDGHDGSNDDLSVNNDGLLDDVVHAEDGSLGQVDDGRSEERTEDTSVGDGEGTSRHVLHRELAVSGLDSEVGDGLLDLDEAESLAVSDDGGDETLGSGDSDGKVNEVSVDDGVSAWMKSSQAVVSTPVARFERRGAGRQTVGALNRGIGGGDLLKGKNGSPSEGGHVTELDSILLQDGVLVLRSEGDELGHVDLVEGRERGGRVLRLLKSLGDPESHPVHLNPSLVPASFDLSSLLGGLLAGRGLLLVLLLLRGLLLRVLGRLSLCGLSSGRGVRFRCGVLGGFGSLLSGLLYIGESRGQGQTRRTSAESTNRRE